MNKVDTFSILIDHDNRLIRYRHSGFLSLEDVGQAWNKFLMMSEFTEQNYSLLSDYRNSTFVGKANQVNDLIAILMDLKPIIDGKKQALLIDNPINTALSILFESKVYSKTGFMVKTFTTEKAALEWLIL